jgi:hypothetical protein
MPTHTDFDELETLEREIGPTLRNGLRGRPMRPAFANALREELQAMPLRGPRANVRRRLWLVPGRAWAGLAAVVAVGLVSSLVLLASRPQPVSAAEVLSQVQAEAVTMLSTSGGPGCSGAQGAGTGAMGFAVARGPDGGAPGKDVAGPVTVSGDAKVAEAVKGSATDLSDKLANALGVSGDRVRNAMIATMQADMPSGLPPDPFASIAQQLGLSREQVCSAFMDDPSGVGGVVVHFQGAGATAAHLEPKDEVRLGGQTGKPEIDLNTATAEQLAGPAQRLGVTPERLAAAAHAAAASMPAPPPPPKEDQIISRFAQNLGLSEDKVRAAIKQVEGNNGFYFAVPVPNFAKR